MISTQRRQILPMQSLYYHQTLYTLFPPSSSSSSSASSSVSVSGSASTSSNIDGYYSESVRVPSSAHVAQIVGKQGAKIKLLRAKSSTFIQTPVPGEEPVFVITGRIEDVIAIKAEIMNAADHFTAIQKEREEKLMTSRKTPGSHQMRFEVPIYLVGLIVGKNGNNIRAVQKETNTYIETPKKKMPPIFIITGQRNRVSDAIAKIIAHTNEKTNLDFQPHNRNDMEIELILLNTTTCICLPDGSNRHLCEACRLRALLRVNQQAIA